MKANLILLFLALTLWLGSASIALAETSCRRQLEGVDQKIISSKPGEKMRKKSWASIPRNKFDGSDEAFENLSAFKYRFVADGEAVITDINKRFYLRDVVPTTVELLWEREPRSFRGHVSVRVGRQVFSFWKTRGVYVETFDDFLKTRLKIERVSGVVLLGDQNTFDVTYDFFERLREDRPEFWFLFRNCVTIACNSLENVGLTTPPWFLKNLPYAAVVSLKQSSQFLFESQYQ